MSLRPSLESYLNSTVCNNSISDLIRLDLMRMDIVKREASGNPIEYDFVPWLYFMTAATSLYAKEVPPITESELWRAVLLGNAKWILHITGRRPVVDSKEVWAQLLEYISQRTELLKEINAYTSIQT